MKLQRESVTGVTLYPFPSRPLIHANLPLATANYINTCTHVKHIVFEKISSRIEETRKSHTVQHGYDALMDSLLDVDTVKAFTDTMGAEYS